MDYYLKRFSSIRPFFISIPQFLPTLFGLGTQGPSYFWRFLFCISCRFYWVESSKKLQKALKSSKKLAPQLLPTSPHFSQPLPTSPHHENLFSTTFSWSTFFGSFFKSFLELFLPFLFGAFHLPQQEWCYNLVTTKSPFLFTWTEVPNTNSNDLFEATHNPSITLDPPTYPFKFRRKLPFYKL